MRRPSFQFYPADWLGNTNLRRCTHAERGIWMSVLCLMHDADEYGVLRWPLADIASAIGCRTSEMEALNRKGVLKGTDSHLTEVFVYVPRSGRKDGKPVTLIDAQDGPIWFSSRMVRDEYVRQVRGEGTRFGESDGASPMAGRMGSPKASPTGSPKPAPKPAFGDGSSSSSSSSSKTNTPQPPVGGSAVGLKAWLDRIRDGGEKPIPAGDPVFAYAEKVGIPFDFVELAWNAFKVRYTDLYPEKRYRDWRRVFRRTVAENWLRLWYAADDGGYALTTAGKQAQRESQAVTA